MSKILFNPVRFEASDALLKLVWNTLLGKTDLVSVAQPLPKFWEALISEQGKNILSLIMKYWMREIGVYDPKMTLHIPNY